MNKNQVKLIHSILRDSSLYNNSSSSTTAAGNTLFNHTGRATSYVQRSTLTSHRFATLPRYNRYSTSNLFNKNNNHHHFTSSKSGHSFSTFSQSTSSSSSSTNSSSESNSYSYYGYSYQGHKKQQQKQQQKNKNNKLKTFGVLFSPAFLLSNNPTTTAMIDDPIVTATVADTNGMGVVGTIKGFFASSDQSVVSAVVECEASSVSSTPSQEEELNGADLPQHSSSSSLSEASPSREEAESTNNHHIISEDCPCPNEKEEECNSTEHHMSTTNINGCDETTLFESDEMVDIEPLQEELDNIQDQELLDENTLEFAPKLWGRRNHSGGNDIHRLKETSDDAEKKSGEAFELHFDSGICVIPHPNKRHKGGEDAFFISQDQKVLGVADGVGGWGDVGIDPSLYSNTLMEGSKIAANETEGPQRHPIDIMEKGYIYSQDIKGSSTCCIVVLEEDNLMSANLGDSGFLVIRDNEVYFRTREQQHAFNMPYQLGTQSIDRPIHSVTSSFEVERGDIIVLGTDGVFDNLFDEEICRITSKYQGEPQSIARMIAKRAYEVGNSTTIFTPFAKNAGLNGYLYNGGKLDDITVIVGIVAEGPVVKQAQTDVLLYDEDIDDSEP